VYSFRCRVWVSLDGTAEPSGLLDAAGDEGLILPEWRFREWVESSAGSAGGITFTRASSVQNSDDLDPTEAVSL
jgi:hypothetical protein